MNDLLSRLRAANPVPHCTPPDLELVWRRLDLELAGAVTLVPGLPRGRLPRGRAWLALPSLAVVALAAIAVALILARDPGSSIVARAYAAVSGRHQVVHYVPTPATRAAAHHARVRVTALAPASASARVAIAGDAVAARLGHTVRQLEVLRNGHVIARYVPGGGVVYRVQPAARAARLRPICAGHVCRVLEVDPVATLRALYVAHRLRPAGRVVVAGRPLDVIVQAGTLPRLRFLVDARTFRPVRSVLRVYGPHNRLLYTAVTRYSGRQRVALTGSTALLLGPGPAAAERVLPAAHTFRRLSSHAAQSLRRAVRARQAALAGARRR